MAAAVSGLIGIVMLLVIGDSGSRHAAAAVGLVGVLMTWAMLQRRAPAARRIRSIAAKPRRRA